MRNITLFDPGEVRRNLLPLTFTRPVAALRRGMLTIREKWEAMLPGNYSWAPADPRLDELWPRSKGDRQTELFIAGNVCPTPQLVAVIESFIGGDALYVGDTLIAHVGEPLRRHEFTGKLDIITRITDLFEGNGEALRRDFEAVTASRTGQPLDPTCTLIGDPSQLFIEPGAKLTAAVLNTTTGPIYIGKDAEVTELCCIRGPFALMEGSRLNLGAHVWPDSTIGPHCRVGGEINNVMFQGYANKAHDGFLGNAVIGEWCNIGAGCVASNLKNNYAKIRLWNYATEGFDRTNLQFCGLIMGDHSKAGINVMFNTATVVGVGCNVYGAGFPRTFIPSFSEGGAITGFKHASLPRFLETARTVMARRHVELTDADVRLLEALYAETEQPRQA